AKANDMASEDTQARSGSFLAVFEQHLQSETDAQEMRVRTRLWDNVAQAARVERVHAVRHRTLTREHDACRVADRVGVGAHHRGALRGDETQRFRHRAQIARPVVDNGDISHQTVACDERSESRDQLPGFRLRLNPGYRIPITESLWSKVRRSRVDPG